ncbi:unannotated protein [freshwater metagenome]|uniref:Unannotated protein n=1 Tax=freshwater metagenome TaxID=449393 RepID=A0A6J7KJ80_9ZZZZ|nr:hypothetical protein [Actinomycetota bacterium]MSW37453.1 hypothetical protein [Actinomycetota bacterium]
MTERGTRVRWTTAALVAPTAAALFTGTTVWAAGHQPATVTAATSPSVPTPTATVTAAPADPAVEALREQIAANSAKVAALTRTVETLRAQTAAISGVAYVPSAKAAGSTTPKGSGGATSPAPKVTTPIAAKPTAPKVVVTKPAPPPPVQTTTGASGAPK